jgi:XTP/dITP diphosphohydrolase
MPSDRTRNLTLPAIVTKHPLTSFVVATNNAGKIAELQQLLSDLPLQWLRISDITGASFSVVEDGQTFEANAILKAEAACRATGFMALADDSGLEVDALAGHPGVRSARFAHEHASDEENNTALLRALHGVDERQRTARFRCVLVLVTPYGGSPLLAVGSCEGSIARQPHGQGGFGYDPLFLVKGCDGRTMADLAPQEKNRLSHRAQAVRNLRPLLNELILNSIAQLDS